MQRDIVVLPAGADVPRERWDVITRLLLSLEVVSPRIARIDRFTKRRFFQRMRVPEYWVVDVDARSIERWTPDTMRGNSRQRSDRGSVSPAA